MRNQRSDRRHNARSLATVTAQVTDRVASWTVELTDSNQTLDAITARPEWCPLDWIVPDDLNSARDPRAYDLLLQKMRLVLDFGSPGGVHAAIADIDARLKGELAQAGGGRRHSSRILPIHVVGLLMSNGEMVVEMYFDRNETILGPVDSAILEQFTADSMRRELRLTSVKREFLNAPAL